MKDFYTIYNMEADDFANQPPPKRPIWIILAKGLAVFFVITIVVFLISNYKSIKKDITDKKQGLEFVKFQDEDQDGMDDNWEKDHGFGVRNKKDALDDPDGDLLNNRREFYFGTNPRKADSDRDGYYDNEEIVGGFNPYGIGRVDSDSDGIYDWWENVFGLDKKDPSDAEKDFDADELKNIDEFKYRTHPKIADSDLDGIIDGIEIKNATNPAGEGLLADAAWIKNEKDQDRDGLEAVHEIFFGTDQNKKDTDDDGVSDYEELSNGRNPKGEGGIVVEIEIPSIEVDLPIAWMNGESKEAFLKGLGQGAILYPGSAFPATRGNSYIFGSSGSYKRDGKKVDGEFKRLSELKARDEIIIKIKLNEKEVKKIIYKVDFKEEVSPEDLRIARDFEGHELTLGATWPPGTERRILMIKAFMYSPKFR
jgi:sortase (surface protein transpeptidase)